jgi:rare lipoprotein A (peptidoglycan hydrolase)
MTAELEEAKKQKKISCHFKLTPWHRDKLVRIAKAARRDMTSIVEDYAEQPRVTASYYGEAYRGNTCADNKTVFDPDNPTLAAHRTLPFGTKVKVSITKEKFIVVTIVDRGPCTTAR